MLNSRHVLLNNAKSPNHFIDLMLVFLFDLLVNQLSAKRYGLNYSENYSEQRNEKVFANSPAVKPILIR